MWTRSGWCDVGPVWTLWCEPRVRFCCEIMASVLCVELVARLQCVVRQGLLLHFQGPSVEALYCFEMWRNEVRGLLEKKTEVGVNVGLVKSQVLSGLKYAA